MINSHYTEDEILRHLDDYQHFPIAIFLAKIDALEEQVATLTEIKNDLQSKLDAVKLDVNIFSVL